MCEAESANSQGEPTPAGGKYPVSGSRLFRDSLPKLGGIGYWEFPPGKDGAPSVDGLILLPGGPDWISQAAHAVRKMRGISQTRVARAAGVSRMAVTRFESPGNDPRFSTVRRILTALGLSIVVAPGTMAIAPVGRYTEPWPDVSLVPDPLWERRRRVGDRPPTS